ncbi:hypothetical protein lerEdw1_020534 [Lerista edwardsae]|nr:hypothetical protein lerEdw1_020534 [Lerista edwardsae]
MWVCLLLSGLAPFLRLAGADDSIPNYMFVLPARLSYPSKGKLCMDLGKVTKSVVLNITLEGSSINQPLLDGFIWHEEQFKCLTFPVPAPKDDSEEVATIRVSDAEGKIDEKKSVLIQKAESGIFVQTDKPVYTPGQLVNFRIVTLNSNFKASSEEVRKVNGKDCEEKDPARNRIAQWPNVKPEHGIAQLSFQLAPEPMLGTYMINVDNMKGSAFFEVLEYVLPKFEVTLVEPVKVFSADSNFPLKVCGRYTYGKPVQGLVQASLCQKAYAYYWRLPDETVPKPRDICQNFTGQVDRTGCFSASVELSQFRLESNDHSRSIDVVAILEETGTGVEANVTRQIYISDEAGSMNFVDPVNYYHPGYTFRGKLKALERDGSALKNHQVYLVMNVNNMQTNQTLTTDSDGVATFSLDTAAWDGKGVSLEVRLLSGHSGRFSLQDPVYMPGKVNLYYLNAYLYLQPYYTTTKSYVKIQPLQGVLPCKQMQEVWVDYSIDESDLGESTKAEGVTFSYYVTGKGKILVHGQKNVNGKDGGLQGSFAILLNINSDFAPRPSLLVYSRFHDGGAIADRIEFQVSMCFKNPVSLAFSQQQELPGGSINLEMTATPGSLCAVRAVDQSVLHFRSERELSNETVYGMFSFYGGYPYQVAEYDHCFMEGPFIDPIPLARQKRSFWMPWHDNGVDFFSFLREMGLKVLTNNKIKKPITCRHHRPYFFGNGMLAGAGAGAENPIRAMDSPSLTDEHISGLHPQFTSSAFESHVRQFFPETWIWDLITIE